MNEHKIAFIIATNNEQYFAECAYYIERLSVPEGYETDVIAVREAKSICEAYNAAMHSSDARYKVYLHQDVFLINTNFIQDIMDAFALDPEVGMLGIIGAQNLPPDAYAFNSWDTGGTLLFNGNNGGIRMHDNEEGLNYVSAIDGMLMITNHDIEWREDIFDGWDFYDLSQSMEFWSAGYKLAVPYQKSPWCMHDLYHLGLEKYDHYRKVFCNTYHDEYGFEAGADIDSPFKEEERKNMEAADEIVKLMSRDLQHGRFLEAVRKHNFVIMFRAVRNNDLEIMKELLLICGAEKAEGNDCFWTLGSTYEEIKEKYTALRFLLFRAQFDCPTEDYIPTIRDAFSKGLISAAAVGATINKCIYDQTKIYKKILAEGIPVGRSENIKEFVCPICGNTSKALTFNNSNGRLRRQHQFVWKNAFYTSEDEKEVYCAACGASAEERVIAFLIQKFIDKENMRVASLTYLPSLNQWLSLQSQISEFISSEKEFTGQQEEDELQEFLSLDDESCDIIIASDTLNHCADDKKTMQEIKRILKKDGRFIVINSMGLGITDTIEDSSIEAEERILHWQIFGGEKNRRVYSIPDFVNRLLDTGFLVGRLDREFCGKESFERLCLPKRLQIYNCSKDITFGIPEKRFDFEKEKRVSVVLLSNGDAGKLRNTITDIANQIYPEKEILIVSDILTEEERNLINGFKEYDIGVIECGKDNKALRRNWGLKNTDGDYLLFIESGDLFDKNYLYRAVKLLEADERCAFAYADALLVENGMGKSRECPEETRAKIKTSGDCFNDMLMATYPKLSSALIRRSDINVTGGFDENLENAGEREFLLRTLYSKKAAEIPMPLVTVMVNREKPFANIENDVDELLTIISEFQLKKRNPEAYARNVSGILTVLTGYEGEKRKSIAEKVYKLVQEDKFFDEADMQTIREQLRF